MHYKNEIFNQSRHSPISNFRWFVRFDIEGTPNNFFRFLKMFLKNYWIFSHISFFIKKIMMENKFIQMVASDGHAAAYTIGLISLVCRRNNYLWWHFLIMVQQCQIAGPSWPNNISSAADNAIFKNRAQNSKRSFGCVACSAVLCKPNVASIILLNFYEKNHSTWSENDRHWL